MKPYDYERLRRKSKEMITRFGRKVTLVRPTQTPTDSQRPWKGPQPSGAETTLKIPGLQLLPNQVRIFNLSALGEASTLKGAILKSEYVYIVFQDQEDIRGYTFVEDGGERFHIEATQVLKPADTILLGYIGVRS